MRLQGPGVVVPVVGQSSADTLGLCSSANLSPQGRDRGEQGGQAPHHHRQLAAALRGQRQNHRWGTRDPPGAAHGCLPGSAGAQMLYFLLYLIRMCSDLT